MNKPDKIWAKGLLLWRAVLMPLFLRAKGRPKDMSFRQTVVKYKVNVAATGVSLVGLVVLVRAAIWG